MRRFLLTIAIAAGLLLAATPVEAHWGWRHCGWGGYGWRGYGWGGYGYRPYYGVGYFPGYYASYGYPYSYGCYGYGCGYGTPVGVGYYTYRPLGNYYNPSANFVVASLPAVPQPTEVNAGPQALKQFLGLKRDLAPLAIGAAAAKPTAVAVVKPSAPLLKPLEALATRMSNAESRRKAERLIAEGDELFRAQNFHSALQRYKLAASAAPDLAEAFWREGHALLATRNYNLAAGAFKRAVALTDDLARGGFRLDDLYGRASMTKTVHLESLAEWALSHSESSDPYFLLGVFLTFDGQPQRAERFFERASDLAGISGGHIAVFLAPAEAAPHVVARAAGAGNAAVAPSVPVSTGTEI